MMDGRELSELVQQRWAMLSELLELMQLQQSAIEMGQMTELMRVLSRKEAPVTRLYEIAQRLRHAVGDDPNQRPWESETARAECRARQQECESMHLQLLALEAECETALAQSRDSIEQQLAQIDSARSAVSSYAHSDAVPTRGSQLDLSSD